MRRSFALWLISFGFYILEKTEGRPRIVQVLKDSVNSVTYLDACSDTGGHSLVEQQPVSEYATYSILNVLRNPDYIFDRQTTHTTRISEYKEEW